MYVTGKYYSVALDAAWTVGYCVRFRGERYGFQTHIGLIDSENPRVRVLGLVPPPEKWERKE